MNGTNHCGGYLEHLQQEHHHLNLAILEIRHQFETSPTNAHDVVPLGAITEHLQNLGRKLRTHFIEEEQGGCMEEAATRCPSVGPQVKDVMNQHAGLERALEQLIAQTKIERPDTIACRQQFESFARDLRVHERTENRLLQFSLGGDAADHDMEGNE